MKNKTLFLGGTFGTSTWREELIPMLDKNKLDIFNPYIENWTEAHQEIEDEHKRNDDICLFVITPETAGFYSAAECMESSILYPNRTIICILSEANGALFSKHGVKAWNKIKRDCRKYGSIICEDLREVAIILNKI